MQIHETTDYEKFKFLPFNRMIKRKIVEKKKALLQKRNKLQTYPVVSTSNMEIIDGQHRFLACKELGLPVFYKIDPDFVPDDVVLINNENEKWSMEDCIRHWASRGKEAYRQLVKFCEEKDVYFSNLGAFLFGQDKKSMTFVKEGKLSWVDMKSLEQRIEIDRKVKSMILSSTALNGACGTFTSKANFVRSICELQTHPDFDAEHFFEALDKNLFRLKQCSLSSEYLSQWIAIYNLKKRDKRLEETDFCILFKRSKSLDFGVKARMIVKFEDSE